VLKLAEAIGKKLRLEQDLERLKSEGAERDLRDADKARDAGGHSREERRNLSFGERLRLALSEALFVRD
jgi:hypothetical protein